MRFPAVWALAVVLALIVVAGLSWTLGRKAAAPPTETPAKATLTKTPITASGLVTAAAISPDGRYVVYVESLQGEQSLRDGSDSGGTARGTLGGPAVCLGRVARVVD